MQFDKPIPDNSHMLLVISMPDGRQQSSELKLFKEEVKLILDENAKRKQQANTLAIDRITIVLTGYLKIPYIKAYHQIVLEEDSFADEQAYDVAKSLDLSWYNSHKGLIGRLIKSDIKVQVITYEILAKSFTAVFNKATEIYEQDLQEDHVLTKLRTDIANKFAKQFRKQHEIPLAKYSICLQAASDYLDKETILSHVFAQYGVEKTITLNDITQQAIVPESFSFEAYPGEANELIKYYREKHSIATELPWYIMANKPAEQQTINSMIKKPPEKSPKKPDTLTYFSLHQVELHMPSSDSPFFNIICFPAYALISCGSKNMGSDIAMLFVLEYFRFLTNFIDQHLKENERKSSSTLQTKHSFFKIEQSEKADIYSTMVSFTTAAFNGNISEELALIFQKDYMYFINDFRKSYLTK